MSNYFRLLALPPLLAVLSLAFGPAWAPEALAADRIVLTSDQSKIVTLADAPSTIVVGNPAIADVTTEGNTIFLHARGFGLTNVVVINAEGTTIADYLVYVVYEDPFSVAVYSPWGRSTFSCYENCEPTMRIGDSASHFDAYGNQLGQKNASASGQALGEDLLLPQYTSPDAGRPNQ